MDQPDTQVQTQAQAQIKKRVRKKKGAIDSLEKLKSNGSIDKPKSRSPKLQPEQKQPETHVSQVAFGKFNITVKKTSTVMSPEDLRAYYDEKFEIKDSEKTAKMVVQDDDNMIYEPLMENAYIAPVQTQLIKPLPTPSPVVKEQKNNNIHKVMSKFINSTQSKWPTKTDLLCWWCCHSFTSIPVPCPIEYDEIRDRYKVIGIFCNWSCVAAYSIKEYSSLSLVYKLRNDVCGHNENITVAPPRYALKTCGGHMTIADYRAIDTSKTLMISTDKISYTNLEIYEVTHKS